MDDINRRPHGCDGCRKQKPTERFDGYRQNHIWLCDKCFKHLIRWINPNDIQETKGDGENK